VAASLDVLAVFSATTSCIVPHSSIESELLSVR